MSRGKARRFTFCSARNYGHANVEDMGVLAFILGRSRAVMKNSVPKSQEGFKGEPERCQSRGASSPPALDSDTICTGGIIKQLSSSSRNYLNGKKIKVYE